jgi:hypothetical protein
VRIERIGGDWALLDGHGASEARWRFSAGGQEVEVVSPSGKAYRVAPGDVPVEVALGLLALRDAGRFLVAPTGESAAAFALRAWLETTRDPLLAGRLDFRHGPPSWMDYRFVFLTAVASGSGEHALGPPRRDSNRKA